MGVLENTRHEKFCQARAIGKSQDESYAEAGYKPCRKHAARLATKGDIKDRIAELQHGAVQTFEVTVESMAKQFDEDRALCLQWKQGGAAIAAGIAKAKLFGLFVEKQSINVTHNYNMMTVEELRFEIAAITAEARSIKPGVQN